jgi:uncharacterized protein (DUF433 family)
MAIDRITAAPDLLDGKPCIRGLRISVETVVRLVAAGWSFDAREARSTPPIGRGRNPAT